ncbi:MAG: 1,4-beta-xylanase [Gammaproteobacteria bacterium RIFCSPHIGHO2_12_FULL_41_20]|nr:MAG: 1,4-beta-xylanase [Gammaproteobacteria bacterium RIFCSPHIGHO2_12_FULL_41_20]
MKRLFLSLFIILGLSLSIIGYAQSTARWSEQAAKDWYATQPWLVGSNYLPASASNQLEMWQDQTFDPLRIEGELRLAESLGFNTMRVFLHDLLWQQDASGFIRRIDAFLSIAQRYHIKPIFVLFDSCWDPNPHLGKQAEPQPGIHNSRWVQSPGAAALKDPTQYPRLEAYVKGLVGAFAKDTRILAWDIWNEPDNTNYSSYGKLEPANKKALVEALLPQVFRWVREAGATQPLTSGVWMGDWTFPQQLSAIAKIQLENSDIISFHSYDSVGIVYARIQSLLRYHRPIICTEYMYRTNASTFQFIMPLFKQYHIGAINWGFVRGRMQTYLPWDSWAVPYIDREPIVWAHDIFHGNGAPYSNQEVDFIRHITHEA